jgi:cytochrome oxidase assembly protein ShyY1
MGLVLLLMMFTSITLLGLWERKRSKKRFQESVRKLRELEAVTLTKAVKQ